MRFELDERNVYPIQQLLSVDRIIRLRQQQIYITAYIGN